MREVNAVGRSFCGRQNRTGPRGGMGQRTCTNAVAMRTPVPKLALRQQRGLGVSPQSGWRKGLITVVRGTWKLSVTAHMERRRACALTRSNAEPAAAALF